MTSFRIEMTRPAEKAFLALPPDTLRRVERKIDALAANPRPPGVVALAGFRSTYRLRVGDWRIVYEVRDAVLLILILRIGHRREVYRGL